MVDLEVKMFWNMYDHPCSAMCTAIPSVVNDAVHLEWLTGGAVVNGGACDLPSGCHRGSHAPLSRWVL